jgi:hypothetical protein
MAELRNGITILDFSISWDRPVGIATRIRTGRLRSQGLILGMGKRFSILHNVQTGSGANPGPYPMCQRLFPQGESAADHSPPYSVEVKNGGTLDASS